MALDAFELAHGTIHIKREQSIQVHSVGQQSECQRVMRIGRHASLARKALHIEEVCPCLRSPVALAPGHDRGEILIAHAVVIAGLWEHRVRIDCRPVELLQQVELACLRQGRRAKFEQRGIDTTALHHRTQLAQGRGRLANYAHPILLGKRWHVGRGDGFTSGPARVDKSNARGCCRKYLGTGYDQRGCGYGQQEVATIHGTFSREWDVCRGRYKQDEAGCRVDAA